jgi:hypothetical protein
MYRQQGKKWFLGGFLGVRRGCDKGSRSVLVFSRFFRKSATKFDVISKTGREIAFFWRFFVKSEISARKMIDFWTCFLLLDRVCTKKCIFCVSRRHRGFFKHVELSSGFYKNTKTGREIDRFCAKTESRKNDVFCVFYEKSRFLTFF